MFARRCQASLTLHSLGAWVPSEWDRLERYPGWPQSQSPASWVLGLTAYSTILGP